MSVTSSLDRIRILITITATTISCPLTTPTAMMSKCLAPVAAIMKPRTVTATVNMTVKDEEEMIEITVGELAMKRSRKNAKSPRNIDDTI